MGFLDHFLKEQNEKPKIQDGFYLDGSRKDGIEQVISSFFLSSVVG